MKTLVLSLVLLGTCATAPTVSAQTIPAEREAVYRKLLNFGERVKKASLRPNWMADGQSFWYAEGAPAQTVVIKVDPSRGTSQPLFDTARLRVALAPVLGHEPPYAGLPFDTFTFVDGESAIRFELEKRGFRLALDSYQVTEVGPAPPVAPPVVASPIGEVTELRAPSGPWTVVVQGHNLKLRSSADGRVITLTEDGTERFPWALPAMFGDRPVSWSPDGSRLLAFMVDRRDVHFMPVLHWLKANHEEIGWQAYAASGETVETQHPYLIDATSGKRTMIELNGKPDDLLTFAGWRSDGSELWVIRADRLFKRVDVLSVNAATGQSRVLLTETQKTFVEGLAYSPANLFYPLADGTRFIWRSERDGWSHLYLYDTQGRLLNRLTSGEMPVDSVVNIDEAGGWVYYLARNDRDRPYDVHLNRASLKGRNAQRLTEATGTHSIHFAPGKKYFLDTHSTADRPPAVELRSVDGVKIRVVSTADISELEALGWRKPEEFRVKAADGKTDLYGVLYKPHDFDPAAKYPVVDLQYMGNFMQSAPHQFMGTWLGDEAQALTQLGFIVFIVDARGTTGRGKAFQDFTYNSIGRIEVPDHVATLRELASTRSYMDTSRVGITGFSWGGYFTIRALLTAPDVFHVGVAGAPVVDFMAATRPIEAYMGLPQNNPDGYQQGSNVLLADRLKGKLLIQIGTSDVNVTFNHTMRMADAFIKAGKLFDLLVMPEEAHALTPQANAYYKEARARYLVEHLKP